jgi:hypothetical protein
MSDIAIFRQLTKPRGPFVPVLSFPLKGCRLCLLPAKSTRRNPDLCGGRVCYVTYRNNKLRG